MKKVTYLLIALINLVACVGNTSKADNQRSNPEYQTYHNDRYHYSVEYPDFLIPQGESDSDDGQKFVLEDQRIQMLVYYQFKCDFNTDGENLPIEKAYEEDLFYKEEVISKTLEKDHYIIESKEGNIMHTHYVIFHDNYFNIYFEYPEKEKDIMEGVIEYVINSFKVEDLDAINLTVIYRNI